MDSQANSPRRFSITVRELFLVILIVAMALMLVQRNSSNIPSDASSRSLFRIDYPVKYRHWHQHGDRGSGTGIIGSGTEWQYANGIDFFETFIVVRRSDGGQLVPREGLTYFDWVPRDDDAAATSTATNASHGLTE